MTEQEREEFHQQFRSQAWGMDIEESVALEIWEAARAESSNLSGIAQQKLDQMGGTVHGVLVKNEAGAWAAVSDEGRVMWLDDFEGQPDRAHGGDAVAYADQGVLDGLALHRANDFPAGGTVLATNAGGGRIPLYTHPPKAQGVPEGWRIRRMPYDAQEAGKIQVDSPDGHHCLLERRVQMAPHHPMNMFYALAESLISTNPASR